jgi:transcriptional antiterminator RfaH
MAEKKWYVINTRPNKEGSVLELLLIKNIDYFCPMIQAQQAEGRAPKLKYYFPGYIFIHVNDTELQSSHLRWIPGSKKLVSYGEEPIDVPTAVIQAIKEQVEEINAHGGLKVKDYQPGDKLKIISGPFQGFEAVFDSNITGKQRMKVLINMLISRKMSVEISVHDVDVIK